MISQYSKQMESRAECEFKQAAGIRLFQWRAQMHFSAPSGFNYALHRSWSSTVTHAKSGHRLTSLCSTSIRPWPLNPTMISALIGHPNLLLASPSDLLFVSNRSSTSGCGYCATCRQSVPLQTPSTSAPPPHDALDPSAVPSRWQFDVQQASRFQPGPHGCCKEEE